MPSWLRRNSINNGEVVVASGEMEGSDNWELELRNAYTEEPAPVVMSTVKEPPTHQGKKTMSSTTKPGF